MGGGLRLDVLPFDLNEERLLGVERIGLPLAADAHNSRQPVDVF
jgi:hypothetical protein